MQRRAFVGGIAVALLLAAGWAGRSMAADIQVGATFEVIANSIWFEEAAQLAKWQDLRKRLGAKALTSYEEKVLRNREARRFINSLTVKVLGHERDKAQVKVEMTTPGRLVGSTWFLDTSALQR